MSRFTLPQESHLGAHATADGCYFAVWAPEASGVRVHIFNEQDEELDCFELPDYQAGVYRGFKPDLGPGTRYALEALGSETPQLGTYFKSSRLLVDPYARILSKPFVYNEELYAHHSAQFIPKAIVPGSEDSFDWEGVGKPQPESGDLIVYELNVRSFTRNCDYIPKEVRGTYLGLAQPFILDYLRHLGVTAVQLLPIAASMTEPELTKRGLHNLWGYNPVCFMAADPRYACNPAKVQDEFRTMVKALHQAGIAVILDVVFNHTAEGGLEGPVLCYKGLDNKHYYAFREQDYSQYLNATGCGNTFNLDEKVGLKLVIDSLRYWVEQMQVDGFRFDLAVTCCRTSYAKDDQDFPFDERSAFLKACFMVDSLRSALMIAEPWDLGRQGYQLGRFPTEFLEQNDLFRDGVRRFWRGDPGELANFATRLMGSRDVFKNQHKPIKSSLNYVTYHDGFTLQDLVSYSHKHNEANLNYNRDGTEENFSTNCGVEGESTDLKVLEQRRQLKRNYLATLLLSLGTPHLLAGDELERTQQGNNNAFCQDNQISYLKWQLSTAEQDFLEFTRNVCALRHELSFYNLLESLDYHCGQHCLSASWYQPNGHVMQACEWENPAQSSFLLQLGQQCAPKESFCILINNSDSPLYFVLPDETYGLNWQVRLDTSTPTGKANMLLKPQQLQAHSLKVLVLSDKVN
ncbi:MAG: glycogen debranching protein GlgX [Succinivibrio sp.]|nr:glycogen debranching protein GlgX [Succinivibrio sp.]